MKKNKRKFIVGLALLVTSPLMFVNIAQADTIYVDDDYATPINGACENRTGTSDDPYCQVQNAIDAAGAGSAGQPTA